MITPIGPFLYSINRGATWNTTLTLVSGNGNIPIDLTGWQANLVVGPYLNIMSGSPTTSGNVNVGYTTGKITLTISGSITAKMYSIQPFYVGLTSPNGNFGVAMNGSMNFISPFSKGMNRVPTNVTIGPVDTTINVTDWDDLTPVPLPPGSTTTSGTGFNRDPIANN